jgi:2-polyprenyl-3-methyl-5-hydroxy-6-metoxy-1,4-benzoquinol methylase
MNIESRNLDDYVKQYNAIPFEHVQIEYRRQLVLDQVRRYDPRRLLEVGCGTRPLFTDLPVEMDITVVEPAQTFADNARRVANGREHVQVMQGFIELVDLGAAPFDMIVLSCVLHETPDASAVLDAIRNLCGPDTTLHINVPNAYSLHRLLAVAMGLIPDPGQQSEMQRRMQQRDKTYSTESLRSELLSSGFRIVDAGSLFVKPFTHSQMQALINSGLMTRAMLDGLDKLVNWLPELGSEIWVNARTSV